MTKSALVITAALLGATCVLLWAGAKREPSKTVRTAPGAISVRTAAATPQQIEITVASTGTVRANEAVEITSQIAARVTAIRFREGTRVRRGDILVMLDDAQARAALAEAEAALANSRSMFQRSHELTLAAAVSRAQLQQLQAELRRDEARVAAAQARLADMIITAPFDGHVGLRHVSLGALVSPGTVITTLDDLSEVKVDFSVPETTLPALHAGLAVQATTGVYPGRVFLGAVESVDPRIDLDTRAVLVRARFGNASGELAPGMFVAVALVREQVDALVIPEGAVFPEQGKQFVFVVDAGKASRREVEVGHRSPGRVQIVSGLIPDERVVVDGALKLRDGMTVSDVGAPADSEVSS